MEEKDKGITKLLTAIKTIHREFDELNRVTKYTDYKGREVKYDYDALGNMVELTYPGGGVVKYEYYQDGNVKTMTSNSGGTFYTWEYKYDNYGRLRYIIRPDGTEEFRDYNNAGDLVEQVDMKGDTVIQKNTYVYDVFGEITTKSTSNTADPSVIQTVNMKYDAENTRIATTVDGKTTEYVTDTGGSLSRMLIAYEADGTETSYYYGAEGLAGQYNDGTKESLYYHYDNIGSTTLLTDVAGKVVDRFVYGTYGELLSEVTKKVRFLFNGAYGVTTDENGLYYMRARYYNPDIKRFINQDIKVGDIGSSQSLNRYAYCEGNPVSLIDLFGLSPQGNNIFGEFTIHDILGIAGLALNFFGAPGIIAAAICDVADAVIYFCEGDTVAGIISVVCAIPGIGDAWGVCARGGKIANTGRKIANLLIDAGKNSRTAAKVADAAKTAKNLIKTAGGKVGDFAYAAGKMIVKGLRKGASKLDDAVNLIRHQGDKLYTSAKNVVRKLKFGKNSDEWIEVYRGTRITAENWLYDETKYLMSDAMRQAYYEYGSIEKALKKVKKPIKMDKTMVAK